MHPIPVQSAEAMDALCEQPPQGRECFSGAFVATAPEMQFNHPSNGTDKLPMEQSKAGFVFYRWADWLHEWLN